MLASAGKLARLIPMLGSPVDAEALSAARAIERTLKASGQDWHDLAREIEAPALAEIPHHASRPRRERTTRTAPLFPEALRLLRAGLALDAFTAWEIGFADTILTAASRPGWRPSRKQTDIAARLVSKAAEAEQHP